VPNNATDTLWMLALGVLLIFVMDFMMRLLRGHFVDLASARIDVKLSALIMERVLGMRLEMKPASVGSFASNLRSFESVRDFIASAGFGRFPLCFPSPLPLPSILRRATRHSLQPSTMTSEP